MLNFSYLNLKTKNNINTIGNYTKNILYKQIRRNFFTNEYPDEIIKRGKKINNKLVPKYYVEGFKNKLNIEEIKDELMNWMDMDIEKKMTPQKIKEQLDRYVIGQEHVKKAIAVALSKILFIN